MSGTPPITVNSMRPKLLDRLVHLKTQITKRMDDPKSLFDLFDWQAHCLPTITNIIFHCFCVLQEGTDATVETVEYETKRLQPA